MSYHLFFLVAAFIVAFIAIFPVNSRANLIAAALACFFASLLLGAR